MTEENRWLTDQWWTTPYNYSDEVRQQFSLPEKLYIHDVTLRESMQSPRVYFNPDEKIRIAKALDRLGVYSIEIGMYMSEVEKGVTKQLINMQRSGEIKTKVVPLIHWNVGGIFVHTYKVAAGFSIFHPIEFNPSTKIFRRFS
jgi:hypothetical protein